LDPKRLVLVVLSCPEEVEKECALFFCRKRVVNIKRIARRAKKFLKLCGGRFSIKAGTIHSSGASVENRLTNHRF